MRDRLLTRHLLPQAHDHGLGDVFARVLDGAAADPRHDAPNQRAGLVRIHGELWQATAAQPIAKGTRVRVVAVEGLTLRVTPASD